MIIELDERRYEINTNGQSAVYHADAIRTTSHVSSRCGSSILMKLGKGAAVGHPVQWEDTP